MSKTLYWLQGGACGGDSMSLLDIESPDLIELFGFLDIDLLWHPSLSNGTSYDHRALIDSITSGRQPLDILCLEGSVIRGPGGTGMYDTFEGEPKKNLVAALAAKAGFVIAVGTCACFGGIGSDGDIEATGAMFTKREKGGFLGESFVSTGGSTVINLPGCPCHGDVISGALNAVCNGSELSLDEYNVPQQWYGLLVHQGCVRNEYHEYRIEEKNFGDKGCLFFHMGCRGPISYGPCNKMLWNRRSSKTRVGVPCVGCTDPDFPQDHPFFRTPNIAGIPLELPDGVDRAHFMAYKAMAAAAAPERLKKRKTEV